MAELAYDLASRLIQNLASISYDETFLAWGIKTDLQKLEHTISTIKDKLFDIEEKQAHNKELRSWLRQLKDIFLDAEDLLDEFDSESLRRQVVETYHDTTRKVRRFFSRSNPVVFHLRLGHEIKDIRERLDELKGNKAIFDLLTIDHHRGDDHVDRHSNVKHMLRESHSFIRSSNVIGRDSEKEAIVDLLMQQGDGQSVNMNVFVICIVGIGGLGKTTLAKLVYNDERVVRHFQLSMWVYVSEDFNITKLLKRILCSASESNMSDIMSMDQLQIKLRDALKDKRFLLILDDIWNEDRIKWNELRDVLVEGAKLGSKILVTTRNTSVASIMSTTPTYMNLKGLSDGESLSLFAKCAFENGREEEQYPDLLDIGKDIVKKCGGVPLAVKTLGSQLCSKTDEREWKLIRDSEIWELERDGGGHILPALRLSYTLLPSHLKRCLAYCSFYPKSKKQSTSLQMINFWMAQGILQSPGHEDIELEDVGELYFKELWARSFFENVTCSNLYYRFDMHDLIHDLVQSVAQGEWFTVDSVGTKDTAGIVRHLSFLELGRNVPAFLQKSKKVRTIYISTGKTIHIDESFLHTCFSRLIYMRVLVLINVSMEVLPSSIGALKHLRYLNLSLNDRIKKLPNTICKLQSLQTLRVAGCENLEELPRDISKLISLRMLVVTTKQASFPENGVGCLKSLRSLYIYECHNLISLPSEMSYLATLRSLVIFDCEQLDLMNGNYQVIPLILQKLVIEIVPRMAVLPEWFRGAANTLQYFSIQHCDNLEALPGWFSSFTSLRKLVLGSCPKLLSLPEGMHRLTSLRELEIENCPELERRCERDIGEDWVKISHIPNVSLSITN